MVMVMVPLPCAPSPMPRKSLLKPRDLPIYGNGLIKAILLASGEAGGRPQFANSQRKKFFGSGSGCFQKTLLRSILPEMASMASRFT